MILKDKRIKCCSNSQCECYQNKKKHKYSANDRYCTLCGSGLVFVCSKCLEPITDDGPTREVCHSCEAKQRDRKDKVVDGLKNTGGVLAAAAIVVPLVKPKK